LKIYFFFHSNHIINLIYQKATYIIGCGELINELSTFCKKAHPLPDISDIYIPEPFIDIFEHFSGKKIIVVNDKEEDVTDSFNKESCLVRSYLIKEKICKYKYVDPDYEKKMKRNDVRIYKTIFYPPKSKSQNTN
jgi:hypothetical protein